MTRPVILLVDDEQTILASLRDQLRRVFGRRFTYEAAASAPEAWKVLDELVAEGATIVVIVSDWLMPEIKGDAFLAEVRARHPGIVRIMLTGQADAAAIQRAHGEAQVFQVMHKPWAEADLKNAIEQGIETMERLSQPPRA